MTDARPFKPLFFGAIARALAVIRKNEKNQKSGKITLPTQSGFIRAAPKINEKHQPSAPDTE